MSPDAAAGAGMTRPPWCANCVATRAGVAKASAISPTSSGSTAEHCNASLRRQLSAATQPTVLRSRWVATPASFGRSGLGDHHRAHPGEQLRLRRWLIPSLDLEPSATRKRWSNASPFVVWSGGRSRYSWLRRRSCGRGRQSERTCHWQRRRQPSSTPPGWPQGLRPGSI